VLDYYARPVFKLIDPKEEYFQKMWYIDRCTSDGKNLSLVFGEDYIAERTDNFRPNPDNGIRIDRFYDQASGRYV
jgi:NLI interacting factor-like phosphatase